ncbi:MAG: TonB family protein [Acidobacteria bacterium]|nr:TonB family protein [Acidobacteriota bacterium]MBS1865751.1 TonB family protein [Acidobacteriota bacterium]
MKMLLAVCLSGSASIFTLAQEPNAPAETKPPKVVKIIPSGGTRIRLGGAVTAPKIIKKVNPVYPPLARQTKIQGTVQLHVVLSKDGSVQQLEALSGHPLLMQSAIDAVRQWKYQPTLLNGEPVEVDTTIDVIYSLNIDTPDITGGPPTKPVDPQLRTDIIEMLNVVHARDRSIQASNAFFGVLRQQLFSGIKDQDHREKITTSFHEKMLRIYDSPEFTEGAVLAYSKYFTDDDIKELIKFYQTPIGQKFNDVLPKLMPDLVQLGQNLVQNAIPDVFRELCKEYPEDLGGKLPNCPATESDKKS